MYRACHYECCLLLLLCSRTVKLPFIVTSSVHCTFCPITLLRTKSWRHPLSHFEQQPLVHTREGPPMGSSDTTGLNSFVITERRTINNNVKRKERLAFKQTDLCPKLNQSLKKGIFYSFFSTPGNVSWDANVFPLSDKVLLYLLLSILSSEVHWLSEHAWPPEKRTRSKLHFPLAEKKVWTLVFYVVVLVRAS